MIKNIQNRQDLKKGFTLIELLVVISIIAVLMAIMMPALRTAREQASRVSCSSNLKQMGIATGMYRGDHKALWLERNYSDANGAFTYKGRLNYVIYDGLYLKAPTYPYGKWVNHGMLFDYGYLGAAKAFYCPAIKQDALYESYFSGDKLLSNIYARNFARSSYSSRCFNEAKGKITTFPIKENSKIAILSDRWTFNENGVAVHLAKYYNSLYGDGHVDSYSDQGKYVTALGRADDTAGANIGVTYNEALSAAADRFGDNARKLQWAAGWLFLDHPE